MKYVVTDVFKIGDASSVTVTGNGVGLKNGATIIGNDGKQYHIRSVAMTASESPFETTTFLVSGEFKADSFTI